MGEPTHAYRSHAMRDDYCEQLLPHDSSKGTEWIACGLPRSAHPASPPGPAPESEEPPIVGNAYGTYSWRTDPAPEPECACLDFWTTHHPECPRVLAGLEKAGVAEPCQFASTPHLCHDTLPPHPEPVDVAKTIVEWLDQNVSKCQHGYITVSCGECMGRYLK